MIRSSMSASLVALVILRGRADPVDHDDAGPVGHGRLEPICVPLHVEDHDTVRQEARARVAPPDVLRRGPDRALGVAQPIPHPVAGIAVLAAEPLEPLAVEYFHSCLAIGAATLA